MRGCRVASVVLVTFLALAITAPDAGAWASGADRQEVKLEVRGADAPFTLGYPVDHVFGWSQLVRRDGGLEATVHVGGLPVGGVFTFWWVVRQGDPANAPFDWFVANGAGAVIDQNGRATVHMSANTGQAAIAGMPFFPPGVGFSPLTDTHGAVVRVEIAYHGQLADAAGDVDAWLADFWTGTACPASGTNIGGQPFCPVYVAAQHDA